MNRGVKRVLALVLAVFLTAGISGAGALMQVSSYEDTVYRDSDSGPVSSEPEGPVSSVPETTAPPMLENEASAPEPPPVQTQETVNLAVANIVKELKAYEGPAAAGNEAKILAAAEQLAALPPNLARRAPDYKPAIAALEQCATDAGASSSVTVQENAVAAGLSGAAVSGAAITSLKNGGTQAVLTVDVLPKFDHRLPEDVTGRDMVVMNLTFTVGGVPTKPILPVTVTVPLPKGARRSNAVVLHYVGASGDPAWLWPQFTYTGTAWTMTFVADDFNEATSGVSEFVLANYVERSSHSSSNQNETEKRIYNYWLDVIDRINSAGEGGEVYTNTRASGAKNVPVTVLDALYRKDVTLYIDFGAEREIVINGLTMLAVPGEKVFYPFWDLANLYTSDGGPAGMRVQLVPTDGDAKPPETYVQTIAPTANRVQNVSGLQSNAAEAVGSEGTAATATEEISSRGEERQSSVEIPEPEHSAVPVGSAAQPGFTSSVPIWAPAAIAGGVLAGLGIGMFAGSRGKRAAKTDSMRRAQ